MFCLCFLHTLGYNLSRWTLFSSTILSENNPLPTVLFGYHCALKPSFFIIKNLHFTCDDGPICEIRLGDVLIFLGIIKLYCEVNQL